MIGWLRNLISVLDRRLRNPNVPNPNNYPLDWTPPADMFQRRKDDVVKPFENPEEKL